MRNLYRDIALEALRDELITVGNFELDKALEFSTYEDFQKVFVWLQLNARSYKYTAFTDFIKWTLYANSISDLRELSDRDTMDFSDWLLGSNTYRQLIYRPEFDDLSPLDFQLAVQKAIEQLTNSGFDDTEFDVLKV